MLPLDKIKAYLSAVCEQIRWKKAHLRITEELEAHIIDQRDYYISIGFDEDTATDQAITDTGDAVDIGTQLDRTHRPKPQWAMLILTSLLLISGIFIQVFLIKDGNGGVSLFSRLIGALIGVCVMLITYFSDYTVIGKYPKVFYWVVTSVTYISIILSPRYNGRSMFFVIPSLPLSHITLLFPLALAAVIYTARNKGQWGLFVCGSAFCLPAFACLLMPSTSALVFFAACSVLLIGAALTKDWFGLGKTGIKAGFLYIVTPVVCLMGINLLGLGQYGWDRLLAALNPSADKLGLGYVVSYTRLIIKGAKLIGQCELPAGSTTLMIPLPISSDGMLIYLIARYGWIAFIIVAGLLMFFIVKGFKLCFRQKSGLGQLVSMAVMVTFTTQAAGYVLYNLGLQFSSPICLPLVSYGNAATVINLGLIGFMLSVFRTAEARGERQEARGSRQKEDSESIESIEDTEPEGGVVIKDEGRRFISWDDGKLTIDFRVIGG